MGTCRRHEVKSRERRVWNVFELKSMRYWGRHWEAANE